MKRFILLPYLHQFGIPELRHLIDRLRNMSSLLLYQNRNPISLRSPLEHDIDLFSVTLTGQSLLKLVIVNLERKFLLKARDDLVDVQNLARDLPQSRGRIGDLVGLLLHLLRVLLDLLVGLVDLDNLLFNGRDLLLLHVELSLRGDLELNELCAQTVEGCHVCFELDEGFEDVVVLVGFTVMLIYQILQLPILGLLLLGHILQPLQSPLIKLLENSLQSLLC